VALRERKSLALRSAVISHCDRECLTLVDGDEDLIMPALKIRWLAVERDTIDRKRAVEIERERGWRAGQQLRSDFDGAAQRFRCGIEVQIQAVVLHIHRAQDCTTTLVRAC